MEDNMKNGQPNTQYDLGSGNHLKMADNQCGCIMEMDVNAEMTATKARMLTCGVPNPEDRSNADIIRMTASFGGTQKCIVDHIANPDNVAMIPEYNQLIIGEDTSSHDNNLIWIYDLGTHEMTRIASTPLGAETTSPYWYTVGDWNYMTYIVQHPESDITGTAGYIGYVGPFPRKSGMNWHRPKAAFEPLTYPEGGEIHDVRTSPLVKLTYDNIGDVEIGYTTLYRSSEMRGETQTAEVYSCASLGEVNPTWMMVTVGRHLSCASDGRWRAGGVVAGRIVDKNGNPIKNYDASGNGKGTVSRFVQFTECGMRVESWA